MKTLLSAVLFFTMCAPAWAQVMKVEGSKTVQAGYQFSLKASSDIPGAAITWLTLAEFPYEEFDLKDGSVAISGATPNPGTYEFVCFMFAVGADGKPITEKVKYRVEVIGNVPPIPPTPPTPIPPTPPTPIPPSPSALGLRELGALAPQENKAAVSANMKGVISQISAGTLRDGPAVVTKTQQLNRALLGDTTKTSHPWNAYFAAVSKRLGELQAAGKLGFPDGYRAAWTEIAEGLQ